MKNRNYLKFEKKEISLKYENFRIELEKKLSHTEEIK